MKSGGYKELRERNHHGSIYIGCDGAGKQIIPDALRSSGATDPKTAITQAEADADRRTVRLSYIYGWTQPASVCVIKALGEVLFLLQRKRKVCRIQRESL